MSRLAENHRERVATSCVCCGSENLNSSQAILMPFVAHRALGYEPVIIDETWNLKVIPKGMAYQICKSIQCDNCGHLFLDIRFSDVEMARLYRGYRGQEYTELRNLYEPGYREINVKLNLRSNHIGKVENFLSPLIPANPRILDWGGDTGMNTPFRNLAKEIFVYDISGKPLEFGIKSIDQSSLRNHNYDVIICSHVLEHIPYPSDLLCEITTIMTTETILYIEVPYEDLVRNNQDRANLFVHKKHWHEHINFFCDDSIRHLLNQSGLKIIDFKHEKIQTNTNTNAVFQIACQIRRKKIV